VLIGAGLVRGAIYPAWIRPLFTIDERIVERRKVLDVLEAQEASVQQARHDYKSLVARIGSFDVGKVETEVRDQLNRLIEKHHLQDAAVSPSRPVEDRKTGLWTTAISISATGSLESTVAFLKDIAELPYLIRVGNPTLSPQGGARKGPKQELLSVRVPVDVWVLPQNRVVGAIREADLAHPDSFVRHQGRSYADIWNKKPFSDYVPPVPLKATVPRTLNVEKGQPATLEGGASGGDGEYTIRWSPPEGLNDPTSLRPAVDTATAGQKTYVLTLSDGSGGTDTASVTVNIREPRPVEVPAVVQNLPPPPPPPPVGDKPWPDGKNMSISMALLRSLGPDRLDEFMVHNNKSKENKYYKVGDKLDGGELVFVHQRGGVVRRNEDYFVYPIGATLDQHVDAKVADDFPELKLAADKIREARQKPKPAPEARTEPGKGELPSVLVDDAVMVPAVEGPMPEPPAEIRPAEGVPAKPTEAGQADEKPADGQAPKTTRRPVRAPGIKKQKQ